MTFEDLRQYEAKQTEPLRVVYRGHPVYTMSPSSTGGIALSVMLNVFNRYPVELGREGSAAVRHLQIEAIRRGHGARARILEDDYVSAERLISAEYAAQSAANLSLERATPPATRPAADTESPDTTQFTIVDAQGNIVSNTYTLSGFFGSQVVARGTGVLLNNHMSAFRSSRRLAPGRRYPSTMAPTIVARPDNSPYFALGTPGASTIPATLFQVIVNVIDFKMSLRDAIEFPRIDASASTVNAEPAALIYDIAERLRAMGHRVSPQLRSQGDVQAIMIEEGTGWRVGWSDGRRGGSVKGY
jgi:gamma-glutamyltranspeptidase/glutathione hydrolase